MAWVQLGKYKSIVVSIALFLLLDASVLILNFYISFEISEDAVGVNIAGRQRMLSQRMVKSLMDINYSLEDEIEQQKALDELKQTVNLFDTTLIAFDVGGKTKGADGGEAEINAVASPKSTQAINEAKELWLPYKTLLIGVINAQSDRELRLKLDDAILYAKSVNLTLLRQMNQLTVDLEAVASSKATRLRIIQAIGISLAIINFFIILFHFLKQLKQSDRKVEAAQAETTKILDTVNEGLFLIDENLKIGAQHSAQVKQIFDVSAVEGVTLEALLGEAVCPKDLENAKRFIKLLYRKDIKSNLINSLNPLRELEMSFNDRDGRFVNKYLSFSFSRVFDGASVKNILVTVQDITANVLLRKELEQSKEQNVQQIELLTGILHANPLLLKSFVSNSFDSFKRINSQLKTPNKTDSDYRRRLREIYIEIHGVKGEAAAMGLEGFEAIAHEFEDEIENLKQLSSLNGDHFLPLVVHLEKLISHTETVEQLLKQLAAFSHADDKSAQAVDDWMHLNRLTTKVAERMGKQVELITSGLSEVTMTEHVKSVINDISVQCIRNSIVHGIETPRDRLESYKPETGRIDIRLAQTHDGTIEFTVKDDGQGINCDVLREKALATGRWSMIDIESWDTKKLVSLIFEPELSTLKESTVDGGRGVGMDLVRQRVKSLRGRIRISTRRGQSTQFTISIPPALSKELAA